MPVDMLGTLRLHIAILCLITRGFGSIWVEVNSVSMTSIKTLVIPYNQTCS